MCVVRESNLGHTGERRVQSPQRHPYHPLTAPNSWCSFLFSFSFFLRSSEGAFRFLLFSRTKSFLFTISASLFTAWILSAFSILSCFCSCSVASSISSLACFAFESSKKERKQKVNTPYSKMAANKLFFCLHVHQPSLPHFHFKILLCLRHADEAKRAN